MNTVTYRISLDVNRNGIQRTIQGVETGDLYSRNIIITLRNNKEDYELPQNGIEAVMYPILPDGTKAEGRACTIDGNKIIYAIQPGDIAQVGLVRYQLKIVGTLLGGASAVLVSPRFELEVWESDADDDSTEESEDFTELQNLIAQANAYYTGKRITDVTIDDEYLITVTFADGTTYESDALETLSAKILEHDEDIEELDTKIDTTANTLDAKITALSNSKADKSNPTTSGTFTHTGTMSVSGAIYVPTSVSGVTTDLVTKAFATESSLNTLSSNVSTFEASTTSALATKMDKANPTGTGTLTIPTVKATDLETKDAKITGDLKAKATGGSDYYNVGNSIKEINNIISTDISPRLATAESDIETLQTDKLDVENPTVTGTLTVGSAKVSRLYARSSEIKVESPLEVKKANGGYYNVGQCFYEVENYIIPDIDALKSRTLSLTSSSPLSSSSASNILGLDALGKSTQQTTDLVNPKDTTYNNYFYNGNGVYTSVSKWRILYTPCVVGQKFKIEGLKAYNSSGIAVATEVATKGGNGTTLATRDGSPSYEVTTTINGYMGITVAYDASASMGEEVSTVKVSTTPTPTSPISIVDASKDVTAIGKNLLLLSGKGYWTSSGTIQSSTNNYYAEKIPCDYSSITLSVKTAIATLSVAKWDANGNFITRVSASNVKTLVADVSDASMIAVHIAPSVNDTVANITTQFEPQLEIGTTATDYVAYQSNKITLPYTLRSVGTVKDELVVNEDGSGKLIRRVGKCKINDMTDWAFNTNYNIAFGKVSGKKEGVTNFMADAFAPTTNQLANMVVGDARSESSASNKDYIMFKGGQTSLDAFKTACGNTYVQYELATPTETNLTAEQVSAIRQLKTYNGTTIVDSEMDVDVTYAGDVKSYIDGKFDFLYELIRSYHPEEEISVLSEVSDDE